MALKTLESVRHDEMGKTRTRSSYNARQEKYSDYEEARRDMECSYELILVVDLQPTFFKEAVTQEVWRNAMQNEYAALIKNGTLKLVDYTLRDKLIGCKWVYQNKYVSDYMLYKHKARLVAKGYSKKMAYTMR